MVRRSLVFSLFLSFVVPAAAQEAASANTAANADKLAKKTELIEQILSDAPGFRLGENRSYAFARAGAAICKSDIKTAQSLFQRSINDLQNAQMLVDTEDKSGAGRLEWQINRIARPNILTVIGGCDAEFALDSLFRTRTMSIQNAIAQSSEPTSKIDDPNRANSQVAQTELNLEQRLTRLAADQNPELALKLLQDSIKKGLSPETLNSLRKLFEKDPESANSLAADAMSRLLSANFSSDADDRGEVNLANAILNDQMRVRKPGTKDLKFDDSQLRSLASKYIAFSISEVSRRPGTNFTSLVRIAEKFAPGSVAALKKLERERTPASLRNVMPNSDTRRVMESNMTAPQILAEARRMPADSRGPLYQNAANKMASSGDLDGAMALLNANFTGRALDNAVNSLNWWYAGVLMNQGKFSEAEALIDQFPESNRRTALMNLAAKAYAKDKVGNKEYAIGVLNKARTLMPDRPVDQTTLGQFVQLTIAFAEVDTDEAFNTFQPVIAQINELSDANAVVSGFQGTGLVRNGEFILPASPNFGFQIEPNLLRTLAKADFDRTVKLLDGLTRREVRTYFRFQLVESGLN